MPINHELNDETHLNFYMNYTNSISTMNSSNVNVCNGWIVPYTLKMRYVIQGKFNKWVIN